MPIGERIYSKESKEWENWQEIDIFFLDFEATLGFLCSGTVACLVLACVCKVIYEGANMCGDWRNSKKNYFTSQI